jgi:hypothetical protein
VKTEVYSVLLTATMWHYCREKSLLCFCSFQYSLHCWQRCKYFSNTKGRHCCISMTAVVRRKLESFTLHVHYQPFGLLFFPLRLKIEFYTLSWLVLDRVAEQSTRRRGSAAARLLGLPVRIPPGACMFVCCECCVCQVEVSATGWSLVQRSLTDCVLSLGVISKRQEWGG